MRHITILTFLVFVIISCNTDDTIDEIDTSVSFFPLEEGNSWEYDKSYYKSDGELFAQTEVYWNVDSCCFYINKLELTPDSVDLGRDHLVKEENDWIFQSGTYRLLGLDYIEKSADSAYLVASRNGAIPYEHYIFGGTERLNTGFGNRDCIRTLSIFYYQNQRIEQYRWFCQGLGVYKLENYKIELLKTGEDGATYLTTTELRDYNLIN